MTEGFKFTIKKTGLAAALEAEEKAKREAAALLPPPEKKLTNSQQKRKEKGFVEPEHAKDRIGIIFDDSGSMSGQRIKDAQVGTIEFLRYCTVNQVAVAVYPMNKEPIELDTNLPELAALVGCIRATGSTPMFETLEKAQKAEIQLTRLIIFSDGRPDSETDKENCINRAIEAKTPIDTVFISTMYMGEYVEGGEILKEIADRTGGYFLVFDRNKVNFGTAFKYLSPGLRYQLAAESFRTSVEEGSVK
jgi:Mg-chelatase subunit ChlD